MFTAIKGYFDGNVFVPLEKAKMRPRQKVIITVLDEFIAPDENCEAAEVSEHKEIFSMVNERLANYDKTKSVDWDALK